ncbi:MAG: general secretion pathway protein GspB [Gammaproteobacteria bacterium]|jgi:general secretion pathway protein B
MSYILEALKKSEQERERGEVPDIKSVHKTDSLDTGDSRRNVWIWLLALVVFINVVIFAVVYLDDDETVVAKTPSPSSALASRDQAQPPVSSSRSPSGEQSVPQRRQPKSASALKPQTTNSQQAKAAHTSQPAAKTEQAPPPKVVFSKEQLQLDDTVGNTAPVERESTPPSVTVSTKELSSEPGPAGRISDLPDSIRRQLPSISFGGHIYSSSVERRSVMINGKKRREGENLGAGLVLSEITPRGAVFEYKGYRFRLNALQDWSYQ